MDIAILLAVAVAAMWFMTSRTRKQQKEQVAFRDLLEPGQYVMTGSGMFGTVVEVEDDAVTIESSPGVTSRWLKIAIAKLAEPPVASEDLDEEYDESEYDEDEYDDEYDGEYDEESDAEADGDDADGEEPGPDAEELTEVDPTDAADPAAEEPASSTPSAEDGATDPDKGGTSR